MSIKLKSTSGGSVSLDTVSSQTIDTTLTLPNSVGSAGQYLKNGSTAGTLEFGSLSLSASDLPADSILNIEQTTKTSQYTTASTTFVDVPGLSVSITPSSASSKILLMCMFSVGGGNSGTLMGKILVGSTDLLVGDADGNRPRLNFQNLTYGIEGSVYSEVFNYLHSPASTSTQTYKLQVKAPGGYTGAINSTAYDGNNIYYGRTSSTMIAMEIKG